MSKGKDFASRLKNTLNQMSKSLRDNDPKAMLESVKKGFDELERETQVAREMFQEAAAKAQEYANQLSRKAEKIREEQKAREKSGEKTLPPPEEKNRPCNPVPEQGPAQDQEGAPLTQKPKDKKRDGGGDPPGPRPPAYN